MTNILKAGNGNWEVGYLPADGARISSLRYKGYEILTTVPKSFMPPRGDYGEYETRPVYGYDDCFPTCNVCGYPGEDFVCRDHGQLCWENWEVISSDNRLTCSVEIKEPLVKFSRILEFEKDSIIWNFEVTNKTSKSFPFLHIMHPLMQLNKISNVELPGFESAYDDHNNIPLSFTDPSSVTEYLKLIPARGFTMLLLRNIKEGVARLTFNNSLILEIDFNPELFPTFGIWWNNSAYPNEDGIRRNECAFEPIPGSCSDLSRSFIDGSCLVVDPKKSFRWRIKWVVKNLNEG